MSSSTKPRMEEQLAQYRARRKEEAEYLNKKTRIWEAVTWIMSFGPSPSSEASAEGKITVIDGDDAQEDVYREKEPKRRTVFPRESSSGASTVNSDPQSALEPSFVDSFTTVDWIILGLKCLMWCLLWKVFILLEFGAVFFIFSAFVFIWYNMRSGPKKRGEISAYSVFNPNCEVIEGTFTAEQFERELMHKMY